ncbi:TBCD protein [Trametes coccinea BRFM310]|uniref:TBCD protein n=1 Tax=Trametes coccinea (strain BRFM310) TaxID=1353009 RepID=A0A1Y2J1F7_TRAC3|nr:TBCD protein [Trametes coccinea BRFM310]
MDGSNADNDNADDRKLYATFEDYEDFVALRDQFLAIDLYSEPNGPEHRNETHLLRKITLIFDKYQEQPYLLDPYLEQLFTPVIETLKAHAKKFVSSSSATVSQERLYGLAMLHYNFIKFRGYKTITRFFPHEIADLDVVLNYISAPNSPAQVSTQWPLRYAMVLWLSLVCMIPFDLEQFDEAGHAGETASRIEAVGKSMLGKAGVDREGAAILLSRLYMRKDMASRMPDFLSYASSTITESPDPFLAMGILRVICEVVKLGSAEQVQLHRESLLYVTAALDGNESLTSNTLIRKLRTKLTARVVIRLLPAKTRRLRAKGRALTSDSSAGADDASEEDDIEVPEEVETVLEDLFKSLRDKDTIVRYSAAKGIARICERLPADFAGQVLDQVLHLFSIHSAGIASIYDMPSIAESTWHGACLACAEIARRGLIPDERLAELIEWLTKALYFDVRKGAHSIGSNVRDAASYVLWSLARAQSVEALQPHAVNLARHLVTVSLFDREIHIRRAASAAFQEYVGRTSLFPHGIDVLRKTDFYAIGVRRNAFLVAAPEVAEHEEYRPFLIGHLLSVTIRHWDPAMRQIGAQSLRVICDLDLPRLGPDAAARAARLLRVPDPGDIHGALLALTELAAAIQDSAHSQQLGLERRKIFAYLSTVPLATIQSPRQELVAEAACQFIAAAISLPETQHAQSTVPHWRQVVDSGLKSRSVAVQEAAASALAAVSRLVDCSAVVDRMIREFETGSPQMQQSLARALGVLDYSAHPHGVQKAVDCLLRMVDRKRGGSPNVEARRNAFNSMPQILSNVSEQLAEHLPAEIVRQMFDALLDGMNDYTSDERGDVGSWVRIACVKGLASCIATLFEQAASLPDLAIYLQPEKHHDAVGGILKQGVERLDNVRQQAGENFVNLLLLPLPAVPGAERWQIRGEAKMKELFLSGQESVGWNDGSWLFPRAVQLLDIERYREPLLAGIVLSTSTKTDSTQRPVASALVNFALQLPIATSERDRYDRRSLARDLVTQAQRNATSNNVVVPILQTLNVLLEADVFESLPQDAEGLKILRSLLSLVSRNASRLKNPQRINVSMRCLINLLPMSELQVDCISQISQYLAHQYPRVRADTAEYLYLVLSSKDTEMDTDEVEDILLETEWSSEDKTVVEDAAKRCIDLLKSLAA